MDEYIHENEELEDIRSSIYFEELERLREEREERECNSPISMESLGLTWRDFF